MLNYFFKKNEIKALKLENVNLKAKVITLTEVISQSESVASVLKKRISKLELKIKELLDKYDTDENYLYESDLALLKFEIGKTNSEKSRIQCLFEKADKENQNLKYKNRLLKDKLSKYEEVDL